MNYNEFLEYVQDNIKDYLPSTYKDATVQIRSVKKNNGLELDGMTVNREDEVIVPTIYLNNRYDSNASIEQVNETLKKLAEEYVEHDNNVGIDVKSLIDYEKMKDKCFLKVVNFKQNVGFLKDVPYKQFGDLAAFCQVMIGENNDGTMTMNVTDKYLERNQIEFEEVFKNTLDNSSKILPYQFHSMSSIVQDIMDENNIDSEAIIDPEEMGPSMYVMTNTLKMNGAATILYPGALENVGNKLHSDFYVLPSSIHEVIIIPKDDSIRYKELEEMVTAVNSSELAKEEILSYKVYEYDRNTHELYISSDHSVVIPAELEMRELEKEAAAGKNSFEKIAAKFWNNEKSANYSVDNEIDM